MKLKAIKTFVILMTMFNINAVAQTIKTGFEEMKERILSCDIRTENQDREQRLGKIVEMKNDRLADVKISNLNEIFGESSFWTDGRLLYVFIPYTDNPQKPQQFIIAPIYENTTPSFQFKRHGKSTQNVASSDGKTLQLAHFANWQMLIVKNRHRAEQVYTRVTNEEAHLILPTFPTIDAHDIYDGFYRNKAGEEVFFGLNNIYDLKSYNEDPGLFISVPLIEEQFTDLITYGSGRVSRGNPTSLKYNKMPGEGGAGAIMGPMVWSIRPCLEGIEAKVEVDEPFVDHMPAINKTDILTHVASPFGNEVPGQWAFASVRPVGRGMLARYKTHLLRLMRNEIYARHGHRFESAPDIQQFFDSKSWYHPLDKPTALSPIEILNVQVIKAEETARKKQSETLLGQLKSIEYNYMGIAKPPFNTFRLFRDTKGTPRFSFEIGNEQMTYKCDESVFLSFNNIIEKYDLLNLASVYEYKPINGELLLDGFNWSVAISYDKKTITSQGLNAWPENNEGLSALEKMFDKLVEKYFEKSKSEE